MGAGIKVLMLKVVLMLLHLADRITSFFGIKIIPVTHQAVYKGLTEEEIKESRDPSIAAPFG